MWRAEDERSITTFPLLSLLCLSLFLTFFPPSLLLVLFFLLLFFLCAFPPSCLRLRERPARSFLQAHFSHWWDCTEVGYRGILDSTFEIYKLCISFIVDRRFDFCLLFFFLLGLCLLWKEMYLDFVWSMYFKSSSPPLRIVCVSYGSFMCYMCWLVHYYSEYFSCIF